MAIDESSSFELPIQPRSPSECSTASSLGSHFTWDGPVDDDEFSIEDLKSTEQAERVEGSEEVPAQESVVLLEAEEPLSVETQQQRQTAALAKSAAERKMDVARREIEVARQDRDNQAMDLALQTWKRAMAEMRKIVEKYGSDLLGEPRTPDELILFRFLPVEVQDMIWTLSVQPRKIFAGHGYSHNMIDSSGMMAFPYTPAMIHTSRRSRSMAKKMYKDFSNDSQKTKGKRRIYLNFDVDAFIYLHYRNDIGRFIPIRLPDINLELHSYIKHAVVTTSVLNDGIHDWILFTRAPVDANWNIIGDRDWKARHDDWAPVPPSNSSSSTYITLSWNSRSAPYGNHTWEHKMTAQELQNDISFQILKRYSSLRTVTALTNTFAEREPPLHLKNPKFQEVARMNFVTTNATVEKELVFQMSDEWCTFVNERKEKVVDWTPFNVEFASLCMGEVVVGR